MVMLAHLEPFDRRYFPARNHSLLSRQLIKRSGKLCIIVPRPASAAVRLGSQTDSPSAIHQYLSMVFSRLFLISRYFMGKNHESETFGRFYLSVQYLQLDPELALSFVLIFQS